MTEAMKRFTLLFLTVTLLALTFSFVRMPAPSPTLPIVQLRGPAEPTDPDWESMLVRLRQEDSMPILSALGTLLLLQIRIDGVIPMWGIITLAISAIVTAAVGVIKLRDLLKALTAELAAVTKRQSDHDLLDTKRYDSMTKQISDSNEAMAERIVESHRELRKDIRSMRRVSEDEG